jgi:hypothetical protein
MGSSPREVRAVIDDLVVRLRSEASPERAVHEKAYLKSELEFLGASVPAIRRAAVALRRERPALSPLLERLVRESRTWALVDGLAASVTGSLVERVPDAMHPRLARWGELRRLLAPPRQTAGLPARTAPGRGPFRTLHRPGRRHIER